MKFALCASICALSIYLTSSCVTSTTLQTARTTDKGNGVSGLGCGVTEIDGYPLPFFELSGRYGFTDQLDAGMKFMSIMAVNTDIKYQYIGDHTSMFASSIGTRLGYQQFDSEKPDRIYDIYVPMYFSVHPLRWFALYSSPQYMHRIWRYQDENSNYAIDRSNYYGGTVGFKLGKRISFAGEMTYLQTRKGKGTIVQIAYGLLFGIN